MTLLALDMIRCDGGTQMRVGLVDDAVESYAERMEAGDEFPPVIVFHDGKAHWLADGFHRVAARRKAASKYVGKSDHKRWFSIDADLRAGTRHDAIRFAISANKKNGLRRTNADKQVAVRAALGHPEMTALSDQQIADEAGVSKEMVRKLRPQVTTVVTSQSKQANHKAVNTATDRWAKTIGADGKAYPARQTTHKQTTKAPAPAPKSARVERATTSPAKQERPCPHCNGTGWIYE